MTDSLALAIYLGLVLVLVSTIVAVAGRLSPANPTAAKLRPYECGVSEPFTVETRWPVRFALVAMLFLVFDVEALFFYPWALLVQELGASGLLAMTSFFALLGTGYAYARARGAMHWR